MLQFIIQNITIYILFLTSTFKLTGIKGHNRYLKVNMYMKWCSHNDIEKLILQKLHRGNDDIC